MARSCKKRKMQIFRPLPLPQIFAPSTHKFLCIKLSLGHPENLETIALPVPELKANVHTEIGLHKDRHTNMSGKYVSRNPARDSLPAQTEPVAH